jgi:hypothetical protein
MGHLGLPQFRNTSLVYPFGISPTVAPGELQDHHFNPPCLHLRRPLSLFILQIDGRSWRCSYLLPQSAMVCRIGDVIFSCEIPEISYISPMKFAMTFAFTVPSRVSFVVLTHVGADYCFTRGLVSVIQGTYVPRVQ